MPRTDDRAARVLARTQEVLPEKASPSTRVSPKSLRPRASEKIIINDQEMDIDRVVQKVRERLSSPKSQPRGPFPPKTPPPGDNPRHSPRSYIEKPSPRSPPVENQIPVAEVRDLTYDPEPVGRMVSPPLSYGSIRRNTREELEDSLRAMDSEQLRGEILRLRSEKTSRRSERGSRRSQRVSDHPEPPTEKIPVYDQETGTWVLYPRHMLRSVRSERTNDPLPQPKVGPPLYRRGTTRDAYPTRTHNPEMTRDVVPARTNITAVNPEVIEESVDIDFDSMNEVQRREFLDEMKMKFAVLKKNYQDFPIPVIHDDDNPKWVYGIYEQLLDMAKGDASQPVYQTGLQVVFLILQVVLTVAGVPAKNFFSFHSRHFHKYNKLMLELGEKWGPIIDVTSNIETKLAISIGWNTVVFAVVSVIANRFGDKWGTNVEQLLDKITTATDGASSAKMQSLQAELDGREQVSAPKEPGQETGSDMMGGIANLLGGLVGGGGGGLGNLLGGLLGGGGASATSTERKPPMYED